VIGSVRDRRDEPGDRGRVAVERVETRGRLGPEAGDVHRRVAVGDAVADTDCPREGIAEDPVDDTLTLQDLEALRIGGPARPIPRRRRCERRCRRLPGWRRASSWPARLEGRRLSAAHRPTPAGVDVSAQVLAKRRELAEHENGAGQPGEVPSGQGLSSVNQPLSAHCREQCAMPGDVWFRGVAVIGHRRRVRAAPTWGRAKRPHRCRRLRRSS
jgi:hypothetical protein